MPVRPLPKDLEEAAKNELFEDPGRIDKDLQYIKEWLSKQPHITARTDDQFLIAFLRGCKYSLERTKEKLDSYFTMKTALKEFFEERDPMSPKMQKILNLGLFIQLPEPDDLGRRVLFFKPGIYDPSDIHMTDIGKFNFMISDLLLMNDDRFVVKGVVAVIDISGMTLGHAAQMTPALMKRSMTCTQDAYPIRQKGAHYIHASSAFDTIFNLLKSFAKEKLRNRLYVHGDNLESLCQHIPQRILPKEYGGEAGSLAELAHQMKNTMESYRDWFMEDNKYRVDESKRPGKPKTYEDLFGIEGSFRQLSVD